MLHVIYIIDSWTICGALATEETAIPYVKQKAHGKYSYIGNSYVYVILEVTTVIWDLKQFKRVQTVKLKSLNKRKQVSN